MTRKRIHLSIFKVFLIGILFFPLLTNAQSLWKQKYPEADNIASKTSKTKNVKKLSASLTSALPDTLDKYRAIFSWIAKNISYDVKGLNNPNLDTSPENVISKGKSICQGYANLFQALCDASGMPCKTIPGWTKNMPSKIGKPFDKVTTHAWNVIQMKRHWYSCDVTWAAGAIDESGKGFKKEFNDFYFCTPSSIFFLNHYPEDSKWFLGFKISKDDFINAPFYYSTVLGGNIHDLKPDEGTLHYKKGQKIKFSLYIDFPVKNILIQPITAKQPFLAKFKQDKEHLSFEYTQDVYSPFLYIFINNQGGIVYKMVK
jgi:hypothetical protein